MCVLCNGINTICTFVRTFTPIRSMKHTPPKSRMRVWKGMGCISMVTGEGHSESVAFESDEPLTSQYGFSKDVGVLMALMSESLCRFI